MEYFSPLVYDPIDFYLRAWPMLTFQKLIYKLIQFWEKEGCIIHQGHDLETGAGTFNPATFLSCLGPEPYHTAYVEPSRRPKDGRYGENPNRMQLFHQFQVILKPSPPDVQKTYLRSLEAIGLNLKEHDIRFVHDDWESPTLGAYGLGWEVWVDGMEVSQFTYFQAVASLPLKPISAEITYGLERLAMYIQNVDNVYDLMWNETYSYGDIRKRSEIEWSGYNFTEASTEMWLSHFDDFETEAKTLIAKGLPLPAYDFVIKASHAFNLLDARGAISVSERTGYIARIRDLARLVAVEYLAMREKEGYPLLARSTTKPAKPPKLAKLPKSFDPYRRSTFLLEIGSEELPASFVPIGMRHLEQAFRKYLEEVGLAYTKIHSFGTPRRLGLLIEGLVEGLPEKTTEKRGPSLSAAFDAQGTLTPQGAGFLKSLGKMPTLDEIRSGRVPQVELRGDYLYLKMEEAGQSIYSLLAHKLPGLIAALEFPKKMRWGHHEVLYPRPIQWIAALYGDKVIPFVYGPVASGRFSYGHSQLKPEKFSIEEADSYFSLLSSNSVIADVEERKEAILKQLANLESSTGLHALERERLIPELVHLSEWPQLAVSEFDPRFLNTPSEVLISEMVEHQRYLPLADRSGRLTNRFVITADNTPSPLILKGNQKVLSARLSDGLFLYEQDRHTPLEQFNQKLELMTFQKELGTMLDKVVRLAHHAEILNDRLQLAPPQTIARAALLCKADLASLLVGEFPALQGTIGKYYALGQKENPDVAQAIEEHWWPRSEQSPLPQTAAGQILSLADKIDNLLGYFSIGLKPTSSSDPYALRRQTIGLLKILIENKLSLNLQDLLQRCSSVYGKEIALEEILRFITSRAHGVFEEYGFAKDTIQACLSTACLDPYDQFCKVSALHAFRSSSDTFGKLWEVYKRAKGQIEKEQGGIFQPALATEPAEQALLRILGPLEKEWHTLLHSKDYTRAFEAIATLQQPLAHLFDSVKILAEDPAQRTNRIALLQRVFTLFVELLDFSQIRGAS